MTPRSEHPAADLRTAITWALEREAPLFTAGELVVLRRMLTLGPDAGELFARLSQRVGLVFRVAALDYACATPEALAELREAELVTGAVPDDLAFGAFTADGLREACQRLGLPRGGVRAQLEARLIGERWLPEPVILVAHRALLDRVTRLGGFDRALAPVERIVGLKWAEYTPTGGPGLFATRSALRSYERARVGELTREEALGFARAGPPPWGRSPFRAAVEAVLASDPTADELAGIPGCAVPHVRALEREGRVAEALTRCRAGDPDPEIALALTRTGRRLARALRAPWPPAEPLRDAQVRKLWLPRDEAAAGPRPRWRGDAARGGEHIEAAAVAAVAGAGREALHAENWLWASLFALVFRELYWLPLPGRLPTPRRGGPLDLGTPTFYRARAEAAEAVLARLRAEGVAPFAASWGGERLDGLVRPEEAMAAGARLDGPLVAAVLERFLHLGWSAAHGLPDLLVLSGPEARLPDAVPGLLRERAFFAEIKGPTDALRDGQRLWHDHLNNRDILVEVWMVSERL